MENNNRKPNKGMRTFVTIWFGQLVSIIGSGLTGFAFGVWVYEETGSATLFALNMLAWTLPRILLSPVAGLVADRYDRRLVMILVDTAAGFGTVFIAIMFFTNNLQVWHIYLVSAVGSAAGAFQWPAYSAATTLLVPKKHLSRASGMNQASYAVSQLAAPAIAGALYVTVGLKPILLADIITYLFALATLIAVRFPQPEKTEEGQDDEGSFFKRAFFGWTYIRQRPGFLGLLCVFASMNFLLSLVHPLMTPYILDISSPDILGYISSATGVGMLAGTLILSVWGGPKRRTYGIFGAEFLVGISMIFVGLSPSLVLIALGGFGIMFFMPTSNGSSQAIWQSKVAQDVQGRVFAIRMMIASSITPLAFILSGPAAENIFEPAMMAGGRLAAFFGPLIGTGVGRGIGLMYILAGLLYMVAATVVLIHPRIRNLETELPDAVPQDEEEDEAEAQPAPSENSD